MVRFPDHEYTVIILGNDASMNATDLAYQVAQIHLEEFMRPESPSVISPLEFNPHDYVGIYDFAPSLLMRFTIEDSSLMAVLLPHSEIPVEVMAKDSMNIGTLDEPITFTRDSTGTVTHASTQNLESERFLWSEDISPLAILEGCYVSEELASTYRIKIHHETLVATGPRGKKYILTRALDTVYTSDTWTMPVVRFFIDPQSQTVSHLEINSPRNHRVTFERTC